MKDTAPKRTQLERREQSVRKLLDAATDMLIEVGYGGATVQRIAERANLSQGGLFRHFASREALMMAVGADVAEKNFASYRREFEASKGKEDPLGLTIRLLRQTCRSRINQAWLELGAACRTNEALRSALQPVARRYADNIEALARELLPDLAKGLGEQFPILVDTMVSIFDGEVLHRAMLPNPKLEDQRLEVLQVLARLLPGSATAPLSLKRSSSSVAGLVARPRKAAAKGRTSGPS